MCVRPSMDIQNISDRILRSLILEHSWHLKTRAILT